MGFSVFWQIRETGDGSLFHFWSFCPCIIESLPPHAGRFCNNRCTQTCSHPAYNAADIHHLTHSSLDGQEGFRPVNAFYIEKISPTNRHRWTVPVCSDLCLVLDILEIFFIFSSFSVILRLSRNPASDSGRRKDFRLDHHYLPVTPDGDQKYATCCQRWKTIKNA